MHVIDHWAWALWLAVPVVATALAALWTWRRGRPPRRPSARAAMRAHERYLQALVRPAVGAASPSPPLPSHPLPGGGEPVQPEARSTAAHGPDSFAG